MSYSIILSDNFKKEAKKLLKKYASLERELSEIGSLLEENPTAGISIGNGVFKIRLSIKSKNKGKSGGGRVVYFVKVVGEIVYLLSIFDKADKANISDKEIELIMKSEGI